ncbi:MAG: hypothetical protein K9G70_12900 [Prolixibacteraceae bacterium]|nr:hypothetical protein [Prolixibacteraceae bacterium]
MIHKTDATTPTQFNLLSFSLNITNPKTKEKLTIARLFIPKTSELSIPLWLSAFITKNKDPQFATPKTI